MVRLKSGFSKLIGFEREWQLVKQYATMMVWK
jgi:hypothetical protein